MFATINQSIFAIAYSNSFQCSVQVLQ